MPVRYDDRYEAIAASWIWDGVGREALPNHALVIRDRRIVGVERRESLASGIPVREWAGTLMPGLVDAHVHLVWASDPSPQRWVDNHDPATVALRMVRHARLTLEGGVTSVRDLGATSALNVTLSSAIESGHVVGPTVVAAGRSLSVTGGHCAGLSRAADGVDDVRLAVRQELANGARYIKLMIGGGVAGKDEKLDDIQYSAEEVAAAGAEARRRGVKVAAHAYSSAAISMALDAGVTSIEHGSFMDEVCARRMAEDGVYLVPTLMVFESQGDAHIASTIPDWYVHKSKSALEAGREAVQIAYSSGVPIVAGSDGGSAANPHGRLWREATLLTECGLSHLDALRACTTSSAELLGIEADTGTLERGKWADFIVVDGNPLMDVKCLRNVNAVGMRGELAFER